MQTKGRLADHQRKNTGTFDVADVVDPNVLLGKKLRKIEERDMKETGDGGERDEEALEIDFYNNAVRKGVELGVPKNDLDNSSMGETDTDNLDIKYIYHSVGEP